MRKTYIALTDTPELKKGAIMQEKCDDGDQDYECITPELMQVDDQGLTCYSRKTVETQPQFFMEVQQAWLTLEQLLAIKKSGIIGSTDAKKGRGRPRK
jgi:hypothetical protein